jgi:hypothetical protein
VESLCTQRPTLLPACCSPCLFFPTSTRLQKPHHGTGGPVPMGCRITAGYSQATGQVPAAVLLNALLDLGLKNVKEKSRHCFPRRTATSSPLSHATQGHWHEKIPHGCSAGVLGSAAMGSPVHVGGQPGWRAADPALAPCSLQPSGAFQPQGRPGQSQSCPGPSHPGEM